MNAWHQICSESILRACVSVQVCSRCLCVHNGRLSTGDHGWQLGEHNDFHKQVKPQQAGRRGGSAQLAFCNFGMLAEMVSAVETVTPLPAPPPIFPPNALAD